MAAPAPTIPPPPVPPANQPSVLSRLLNAVSSVYTNPADAPLLGLASGFGAAGAPRAMTPISMGQAVNMANQSAQAYRQQVVGANIQQEAALPYQVMRTQALEKSFRDAMNPALPAHQRAAAAYRVDSMMGWNAASDPTVANRLAQIKAGYQPVPQAPGRRSPRPQRSLRAPDRLRTARFRRGARTIPLPIPYSRLQALRPCSRPMRRTRPVERLRRRSPMGSRSTMSRAPRALPAARWGRRRGHSRRSRPRLRGRLRRILRRCSA